MPSNSGFANGPSLSWLRFAHLVLHRGRIGTRREKILHSEDFWSGARCALERANAQRAAPFGRPGIIGFVLNDSSLRARTSSIPRSRLQFRSIMHASARSSATAADARSHPVMSTSSHTRRCCAFDASNAQRTTQRAWAMDPRLTCLTTLPAKEGDHASHARAGRCAGVSLSG